MKTKSKEFNDLQAKWYKKLKDSGFEDAEQDPETLKQWTRSKFAPQQNNGAALDVVMAKNRSKQEYYRLAGHFLYDFNFTSELHRLIWELHSDGLSHRDISDKLKENGIKKARTQVLDIIHELKKELALYYGNSNNK